MASGPGKEFSVAVYCGANAGKRPEYAQQAAGKLEWGTCIM